MRELHQPLRIGPVSKWWEMSKSGEWLQVPLSEIVYIHRQEVSKYTSYFACKMSHIVICFLDLGVALCTVHIRQDCDKNVISRRFKQYNDTIRSIDPITG